MINYLYEKIVFNSTTSPRGGLLYALQPEFFGDGLAIELATPA